MPAADLWFSQDVKYFISFLFEICRNTEYLSRKQLAIRERQSHNNALWRALKNTEHVYMEGGDNTTYSHFMSINMESPVPYFTKQQYHSGRALLLPNMIISDGPLQSINYQQYTTEEAIQAAAKSYGGFTK